MTDEESHIQWTPPLETIVKDLGEQAQALAWAHDAAQRWCASWNTRLMFPSIILATLAGAGAVGAQTLLPFDGANTVVGIASLVVGMLQTVQNYFAFAKRTESHRIATLQYGKIRSHLSLQLSLSRDERKSAEDLMSWLENENDRLSEIVPQIPTNIKELFKREFAGKTETSIPSILNGLDPLRVNTTEAISKVKVIIRQDAQPKRQEAQSKRQEQPTKYPERK